MDEIAEAGAAELTLSSPAVRRITAALLERGLMAMGENRASSTLADTQ
jgi:hypothetical protein